MTDKLPPQLLQLFQPRPPLRYIPPQDTSPEGRANGISHLGGVASFLTPLAEYVEEDEYTPSESWLQKKDRVRQEKLDRLVEMKEDTFEGYRPEEDPQIRGDPFRTLFVGRLSYDAKETDLEREFSHFGPIERIRIVKNDTEKNTKKSHRGYAFVVYEREKDMKAAYKESERVRIKDRPIVVDVERGRTVKGWKPRRFGGGLGGRGYSRQQSLRPGNVAYGMPAGPGFSGGGFRGGFGARGGGGFRGGFRGDRGGGGGGYERGGGGGGYGGRGGIGYQNSGGFGGGGGGGRGGYANGAPPPNAPSGPGGGRPAYTNGPTGSSQGDDRGRNGYGDRDGQYGGGGRSGGGGGAGRYEGRDQRGITGSNREPVVARDRGYGSGGGGGDRERERDSHRDGGRDRDRGDRDRGDRYGGGGGSGGGGRRDEDHGSRKRYHDGDSYDDPRSKRRY